MSIETAPAPHTHVTIHQPANNFFWGESFFLVVPGVPLPHASPALLTTSIIQIGLIFHEGRQLFC